MSSFTPILLVLAVCVIALVATIAIGLKPEDKHYSFSRSFKVATIIYAITFIVAGAVIVFLFTV